jgi:hypothetical protein
MKKLARFILCAGGILACTSAASADNEIHIVNTCDYSVDARVYYEKDMVSVAPLESLLDIKSGDRRTFDTRIGRKYKEYKIAQTKKGHVGVKAWHHNIKKGSSVNLC